MNEPNNVIKPISEKWQELNELIESLGPSGLTIKGHDGWAVKDHLVHLAAWEQSLMALFDGVDRAEAMGAPGLNETDEINAAVWAFHKGKTPQQALDFFRDTHRALMSKLERLSDSDLQLAYNHYQPNDPKEMPAGERPVLDWVAGNTYDHYAEHIGWINQLVRESSAAR